ncbi:MAG: Lrp/AsnC family transcriptional regulator [Clostridia bacterium]|nr:Lrp/AsnC family transcriptional regulator [Clostridia bacterium]
MSHIGKKIDEIDIKIITYLRENCRTNASTIAADLGMSVSAIIDRIKKLEKSGVIKQYSLILDTSQVGLDVCAFVEISTGDQSYLDALAKTKKFVETHPEVVECHSVTGTSMFIMKVYTSTMNNLEKLLGELQTADSTIQTKTSIVLNTIKQETFANLEEILK